MIDRRPAAIVRCAGSADVVASVSFAREHDILVSVRGGGHNVAGKAVADGAFMIDLSAMRAVHVDPARSMVRVAGGALWSNVDNETQAFGLATTGGTVAHTGVAGLTLGGGLGWLGPLYGLTSTPAPRRPRHRVGRVPARDVSRSATSCSGRCAVAGGTSESPPPSSSAFIRSGRSCTEVRSCGRPPSHAKSSPRTASCARIYQTN